MRNLAVRNKAVRNLWRMTLPFNLFREIFHGLSSGRQLKEVQIKLVQSLYKHCVYVSWGSIKKSSSEFLLKKKNELLKDGCLNVRTNRGIKDRPSKTLGDSWTRNSEPPKKQQQWYHFGWGPLHPWSPTTGVTKAVVCDILSVGWCI